MRTFPLLAGLALVALAMPLVPTAAAGHGSDVCYIDTNSDVYSCTFVCHQGDRIHVRSYATGPATTDQWPAIEASCGGVWVYCQDNWQCETTSEDEVQTTSVGTCIARTVWTAGECRSIVTPTSFVVRTAEYAVMEAERQKAEAEETIGDITSTRSVGTSVGPHSTDEQPSRSIDTPHVAKLCTLGDIVCIGPVQSIHVTNTPGVGPVEIVPYSGFEASFTDPGFTTPTVQTTPTGPHQVTGEPAPIVICQSTCPVPTGVSGGPSVSLTVTVFVGPVSHTETLP